MFRQRVDLRNRWKIIGEPADSRGSKHDLNLPNETKMNFPK
jgi:hypothetical protein